MKLELPHGISATIENGQIPTVVVVLNMREYDVYEAMF
jgi:hypothetical protein